jgi:RimJ/RimL family protein N-acetyltransferase
LLIAELMDAVWSRTPSPEPMTVHPSANRAAVITRGQAAIRPFDVDDATFLRDACNDINYQAAAFPAARLPRGLVEFERRLRESHPAPLTGAQGAYEFAVTIVDTELAPIGLTGFYDIDWQNRHAELGTSIMDPDSRGKGIGFDANAAMLDYAFGHLALHRVFGHVKAHNIPARHVCERLGFTLEGTLREHRVRGGETVDLCVYGLLLHEWAPR